MNAEFVVVPHQDRTRVDIALFLKPAIPSVFLEIKAVGQMQGRLPEIELQVRDYNRNNTALFSIITDGREWRFYFSQTGGEFSQKCFESFDILKDNLEDIEHSLLTFLKKSEIANENARKEAENYLQLNQKQRTMEDCMAEARRLVNEPPFPSLPLALVSLVNEKGFILTIDEAVEFIKNIAERKPPTPYPPQPPIEPPGPMPPRAKHRLNPDTPGNLFYTKITEGRFADTNVTNWKELVDCAMRMAFKNGVPYSVLKSIANVTERNPGDASFHQIEGTHLWIQGMDANQAWRRSLTLAKKIGAEVQVVFFWRGNEGAAHPGEEGMLRWSPSGR